MADIEYKSSPSPEYMTELLEDIRARLARIEEAICMSEPVKKDIQPRHYVYGIRGIMRLFGVSNVTAQRLKRTIIKEAVSQNGRIIVTDADKAIELFNDNKGSSGDPQTRKILKYINGEEQ